MTLDEIKAIVKESVLFKEVSRNLVNKGWEHNLLEELSKAFLSVNQEEGVMRERMRRTSVGNAFVWASTIQGQLFWEEVSRLGAYK